MQGDKQWEYFLTDDNPVYSGIPTYQESGSFSCNDNFWRSLFLILFRNRTNKFGSSVSRSTFLEKHFDKLFGVSYYLVAFGLIVYLL